VVDSGDGVTHVIPVADGYVIGSSIRHIPLAGRSITDFIQRTLRERGEPIPPEDSLEVAKKIKEDHCYVSQDIVKEYEKFDRDPAKRFGKATFKHSRTRAPYTVDVGYESFLGPELFFNPEIYSSDFTKPLPEIVDESILNSPIDCRRGLYRNIVLSGGSTMFHNFHKRLQQDIKDRVHGRMEANLAKLKLRPDNAPQELKVKVVAGDYQRYAVWLGGSMLANSGSEFHRVCISKAQYEEEGPRCARFSPVFQAL
jgi:actin-related protein 3